MIRTAGWVAVYCDLPARLMSGRDARGPNHEKTRHWSGAPPAHHAAIAGRFARHGIAVS